MDRLTSIEAFVRVADAGSFAGAARSWGRSRAVMSKYVSQLEEHLGVRLLHRTTRSVSLTDAGRVHVERCRQILTLLDESEAQLRADHVAPRGLLRVTAPPGFLSKYRQVVISDFLKRFPEVELEIDLTHRMVDLVEERIDVAIRLTRPGDSSLIARRLAPAPLVLVASPTYLERAGVPSTPGDLAGHACLVDTNFRFRNRWPVGGVVVEVGGPARANSPLLVRDLALDGLGIALTPALLVEEALADGTLVEVLPGEVDTDWSVWAVTSDRRHLPARARAFLDHLAVSLRRRTEPGSAARPTR